MKKALPLMGPPLASCELCPLANPERSQPKSAFHILSLGLPSVTTGGPLAGPRWMLLPEAGSQQGVSPLL